MMFEFQLEASEGLARAGRLTLPHGTVATPWVPTGMKAGVATVPWGRVSRPARAKIGRAHF